MNEKKNIIVYDCDLQEINPFQVGLSHAMNMPFETYFQKGNYHQNMHRTGKFGDLKRYFIYFWGAFKLYIKRNRYNYLICWQQFYALCFGFYFNLFHNSSKDKKFIIIASNYTYKEKSGNVGKLYKWFMRFCLKNNAVDYIHIPSEKYAQRISRELDYPMERIIIVNYGIVDENDKYSKLPPPEKFLKNSYALSIGRSNRDYDFLVKAWNAINEPLIIISDTYHNKSLPDNVIVRNDITAEKQYAWINNAKFIILSLDDGNIASGDTVLLTAMSLAKIIIVTKPSTLDEMYIKNGVNGISVQKENCELLEIVMSIIQGKYDYIEKNARNSFVENFSRKSMGEKIGKDILGEV